MKPFTLGLLLVFATTNLFAQMPTATEDHKVLQKEIGEWEAKVTSYMGPTGPYPEPQISKAYESNRMVGEFWLVSDFKGDFGGMPFTGHGMFGFDSAKKKYSGSWIDSFSMTPTKMTGTYDKEKKTMTYETVGVGMDGKPMKGKNVVVYTDKDHRKMTMHMAMPGQTEMETMMMIEYVRAKSKK